MTTRLFHFSDPHFGIENRSALDQLARAVADEKPDGLICTGDLTQRAKHSEFDEARQYFSQFECPIVLCAGNHDMPYYNLWERLTDPYRRFRRLYADVGSAFESDDVVLVPLVTTVRVQPRIPLSDGVVRTGSLDSTILHLRSMIADTRLKLVFCHHPLLGPDDDKPNPTIGGDNAFSAIAANGADAVISGHVHVPFDSVRSRDGNKMRMMGAGTLSNRLRGCPPSYQVLTCCKNEGINVERRIIES